MFYHREIWLEQIKTHQYGIIPVEEVKKHKSWFEYLFSEGNPSRSTFRCRLCSKYYDEFKLDRRYKTALAFEDGVLKSDKYENKKALIEHPNNQGHKIIIQILQEKNSKK